MVERVLRRQDEEGIRRRVGVAVHRDLALGHRLEEGGLRARHGAVDLVDEDDVREHGARPELELALLLVVDGEAGDVGGLEVGRALDARGVRALDRLGDRAREDCLGRSGHVLEEHVVPAEERGEDEPDLLVLADDDALDVREQAVEEGCRLGERGRRLDVLPDDRAVGRVTQVSSRAR